MFTAPTYTAFGGVASAQLAVDPTSQQAQIALARSYNDHLWLTGETDTATSSQAQLYSYSGRWPTQAIFA